MKIFLAPLIGTLLLTACSEVSTQYAAAETANILPNSLNIAPIKGGQIIPECEFEKILAMPAEITCVGIEFPKTLTDADNQEAFAINLTRQYVETIIAKGWSLSTDWPLVKSFEKPLSEDCSQKIKVMTWLVDETKPVEKRNFKTSRFTFLLENDTVCGDKRKFK